MARHRGRGIASINYPIGMNLGGDPSQALVHSNPSGKFTVALSSIDLGQGMKSVTRQICAETLGVPVEDVYVDTADSDTGPHCMGTFASRGTHRVGNAVMAAAQEARGVMMEAAAEELEVNAADLETDGRGNIHVKARRIARSRPRTSRSPRSSGRARRSRGAASSSVPLSAVDPETGEMYAGDLLRPRLPGRRGRGRRRDRRSGDGRAWTAPTRSAARSTRELVEQQLVGGAWMGISHALYETTGALLSRSAPRPARLQRIPDAGSGRHLPARHRGAGAPGAGRSVRRQGSGRDVRQSGAAGGRQCDLQRRRRAHRRTADHAGEGPARRSRRRAARRPQARR